MFANRYEAGLALGEALRYHLTMNGMRRATSLQVLSIPRGGVVVGGAVAEALGCDHDVIVVKKIGFPLQEEFAAGAMAENGEVYLNPDVVMPYGYDPQFMQKLGFQIRKTRAQIERYIAEFRQGRQLMLAERMVMVVDDGIATGETVKAAVRWLKAQPAGNQPRTILVAAPVGAPHTIYELTRLADEVICLYMPADFHAVGQFYHEFPQVDDAEVRHLLLGEPQMA